jgi:hypothetical protein
MNSGLPLDRSTIFLSGFAPKRLISYICARQARSLTGQFSEDLRNEVVSAVSNKDIEALWQNTAMRTASVVEGTSYAEALNKMNDLWSPCIAAIDAGGKFSGIVDRDRIANSLLLALSRTR